MEKRDEKYWAEVFRRRFREKREYEENLRLEALKVAEKVSEFLVREYGVRKVILFGSVLYPGRFTERSDIDICAEGLEGTRFFSAVADVMERFHPFRVSLFPMEDLKEHFREKVLREGKVLYEKER